MSTLRIIYQIAHADFLERVRRYSFLVMLGLVLFLGYQTAIGNLSLELGTYRGEFNSAWVGAMMSLIATFFIGWFGFYIVKGSVARDHETGVGQIMATTPLTRLNYLLGKWLSNFAVLMAMVFVLALAGIAIQFWQGENNHIDLIAFLDPFLLIVMPLMAIVAAWAVFYETVPFLRGGFGNIVYFFAFIMVLPLFMENSFLKQHVALEPMGLGLLSTEMGNVVTAIDPTYDGSFTLGAGGFDVESASRTFIWNGIPWTTESFVARVSLILVALGITFLAALFFDRFDPSRSKPKRIKKSGSDSPEPVSIPQTAIPAVSLTPLNHTANRFSFFNVLLAELKLMVKGQRWWWYLVAVILIANGFVNDPKIVREIVLPIAWIWHILLLSPLGNRESRDNVEQLAFSSASPLWRQLPAQWLAGFIVTLILASGSAINFIIHNEMAALFSLMVGAVFIPSLALALGVWSGTSKVFEVVFITLWYVGPMNHVSQMDYVNTNGAANPLNFLLLSIILITAAFIGRARQLQN